MLTVGTTYNLILQGASGGTPPLTYEFRPPPPAGLTLNAAQTGLTGTPAGTAIGSSTHTYTVTDAQDEEGQRLVNILILPLIETLELENFSAVVSVGEAFSRILPEATGGVPPYTHTVTAIDGLLFNPATRRLAGTITAQSIGKHTHRVTDSNSPPTVTDADVTLSLPPPLSAPIVLISGSVGDMVNASARATGGTPPYTLSLIHISEPTRPY